MQACQNLHQVAEPLAPYCCTASGDLTLWGLWQDDEDADEDPAVAALPREVRAATDADAGIASLPVVHSGALPTVSHRSQMHTRQRSCVTASQLSRNIVRDEGLVAPPACVTKLSLKVRYKSNTR